MAKTVTFYKMGFRMNWPEAFEHTKGMLSPMEIGGRGDGTFFMMCTYFATSAEDESSVFSAASAHKVAAWPV